MARIRNRIVVITGAASGVGRACALEFARRGASVIVTARPEYALEDLARACRGFGGRSISMPADPGNPAETNAVARAAVEQLGRLDVWVNNAAVKLHVPFSEVSTDEFRRAIESNLFGFVNGARAALPWFRSQGGGVLIFNAVSFARAGASYDSAWATSRAGIVGFAESLRWEVRKERIRVCTVLPAEDGPRTRRLEQSPLRVARTIVSCAAHPRDEVVLGRRRGSVALSRRLARRNVRRQLARDHAWGDRLLLPTTPRPAAARLASLGVR
ncbi:MAG: SDR family NAD(P)-dependent oxidoreductase, partial [Myxococcaceae bacterium]